jgi:hypothetical protein
MFSIGRVNIEFFPGWKKIKQRRISFVLSYLRMILWKISTAIYLYGFLNQCLGLKLRFYFIKITACLLLSNTAPIFIWKVTCTSPLIGLCYIFLHDTIQQYVIKFVSDRHDIELGLWCLTPLWTKFQWRSVLLPEEPGGPGEHYRLAASHWQTLSHNVVSRTSRLNLIPTHKATYCIGS